MRNVWVTTWIHQDSHPRKLISTRCLGDSITKRGATIGEVIFQSSKQHFVKCWLKSSAIFPQCSEKWNVWNIQYMLKTTQKYFVFLGNMEWEFPGSENNNQGFHYVNVRRNIGETASCLGSVSSLTIGGSRRWRTMHYTGLSHALQDM